MNTIPRMVYLCWGRVCTIYSWIHQRRMLSRNTSDFFFPYCRSTHSGWKIGKLFMQKIFFSVIFGVFVPFSSTATTIRPAFSSTYSLIHSSFVSQAVCTLYNLTDCAYANIQFRFVFKGFYFEKLVLTKIESTIEYMVFGSSYLHRVCERRFMLFFFKWPHFRIHWEWFLLNALHRGISNAIVLLKLIQNIHALSLCWKWTHLFNLNAMHHVAACINDLWRHILLM